MATIIALLFLVVVVAAGLAYYFRLHFLAWKIGLPKPQYTIVIEKDVMVSTHDGLKLATDIYRPDASGKFPVLITRTPYNKNEENKQLIQLFASQGYVFIVQDVRGKHNSEGIFEPYINESIDGHTTIDWAGKASWSNGHVALFGIS